MNEGILLANIDVGLLTDPKVLRLGRIVPDEGERACTIVIYVQTVLQSWHTGRRLTVEEAEGLWAPSPARIDALVEAKLLDAEHRVPEAAWEHYYGPARARIENRRESGRKGGYASGKRRKQRSDDAPAPPRRRSSAAEASLDLLPADPPSPEGEAGGGRAGLRVLDAPARPPVDMNHLDQADTAAMGTMLRELAPRDGRRPRLERELRARSATEGDGGASRAPSATELATPDRGTHP